MTTRTYSIMTNRPAPSMSQDKEVIEVASYRDAVAAALRSWRKTRRHTLLFSGPHGAATYWWHRIDRHGVRTDRNTNSGVLGS